MISWTTNINIFCFFFLSYKTGKFQAAKRLFSKRPKKTSKCGNKINDTLMTSSVTYY